MRRALVLAASALCAPSCFQSDRQAEATTHTDRAINVQGSYAGQPFVVTGTEDVTVDNKSVEHRQIGIDPQLMQLIGAGAATVLPGGAAVAGIAGVASAALAAWLSARKSAQQHQADANEGWSKYEDAMKAKKDSANG